MSVDNIYHNWKQFIKNVKGGKWWSDDDDDACLGYGDACADTYTIAPGRTWGGQGPALARFEPFVFFGAITYTKTAGDAIGDNGTTPLFVVTPFETDARDNKNKSLPPRFQIDGGLVGIPFPATIQLQWPGLPNNAAGRLSFQMTTYGPARRGGPKAGGPEPSWARWPPLAPLGADRWHVTRWHENARAIPVPEHATRFRLSDSAYGVRVGLFQGSEAVPAPFGEAVSLGGSPDLRIDVLAPLAGVAPTRIPVEYLY